MKKKQTFSIQPGQRIIAISDIHGHLKLFHQLLDQIGLTKDDFLIVLGDFINKGPDNLAMIHDLMALEKRPNTLILKGNHESFIYRCITSKKIAEEFFSYLKEGHFPTILHDMLKADGLDFSDFKDGTIFQKYIQDNHITELDFIKNRPVIAVTEGLLFVHGGYDPTIDLETEEEKLLKFDDFNRLSPVWEDKIIVGHWPTSNLRVNRNTNIPYFNQEKNIITIDGGMGVKSSGELNALIITASNEGYDITYEQANTFSHKKVIKGHVFHTEEKLFINYPHFEVEKLTEGPLLTKCRHLHSGKEISIFNCLLEERQEGTFVTTTYINHFIDVHPGEDVLVCLEFDDCVLIKHNDELGWILKEQIA